MRALKTSYVGPVRCNAFLATSSRTHIAANDSGVLVVPFRIDAASRNEPRAKLSITWVLYGQCVYRPADETVEIIVTRPSETEIRQCRFSLRTGELSDPLCGPSLAGPKSLHVFPDAGHESYHFRCPDKWTELVHQFLNSRNGS